MRKLLFPPILFQFSRNLTFSITSKNSHNTSLFNLYFLDSHGYAKTLNPWTKKAAYDWLKPGQ